MEVDGLVKAGYIPSSIFIWRMMEEKGGHLGLTAEFQCHIGVVTPITVSRARITHERAFRAHNQVS